jgi:ABC-type transport system substrate-binding protein
VLRLLYEAPSSLDPEKAGSVYESLPINQIFNGLVALDATMNVVPSLASTWTITRDGLTYEFHLRPGVRFHDGSPLTAEDVVFTIRRLLAPGRPQRNVAASYLDAVEGASDYAAGRRGDLPGVTAEGREIVRIRLERPYLSFLQVLAMDGLKIVPQAVVERIGDEAFGRAPIGTGSFRLASWDSGGLRLAAWEGCFLDPPRLDVVEILSPAAGESDGGVGRFDRGETDVLEVPAKEIGRFSHADGVRLHRYQELNLHYLGFCTAIPPLDDIRVRQAIAHAVDPRVLVDEFPGARREATGILPPGLQGFSPEPKTLAFSRETSRRLLAEAGYPEGRGLPPIELLAASSRMDVIRRAETLSAQAATVGIRMNVRQVSWGELSRRVEAKRAPAFLLGWIADLPDPDSFLRTPFEPGGTANYFDLRDATVASLLDQGGREMNPVLRTKIYRQTERLILQLAPLVPLYHSVGLLAVRSRVGGFDPGPLGLSAVDLSRTWVSPGGGR